MSETHTPCHREGGGYVTKEHQPDCKDILCGGCKPCVHDEHGNPVRHCAIRSRCTSHLDWDDWACPACLTLIRANLTKIVDHVAVMPEEAIETGVDSEAANLAGPVANHVRVQWRMIDADRQGIEVEELDRLDPYTCLASHERHIREDLGHDETTLASDTLTAAAGYLDWVLTDLARREDQVLILADLLAETSRVVAHLESVLHDGRDGRGAPCSVCGTRLVKRWADWDRTGANDVWRCPKCDQTWSEGEYQLRVGGDYREKADRLNAKDLADRLGVAASTVRRWASEYRHERDDGLRVYGPPLLHSCGRDGSGRKLYRVTSAEDVQRGMCDWPRRGAREVLDTAC